MQHISKQRIQKFKQIKTTAKDSNKNQSNSYFCLTKKKTNKQQVPESESKKSKQKKRKNKQQKHIKYMNFQTNPPKKTKNMK